MYSNDFVDLMIEDGVIVAYAAEFQFPAETLRNWTGNGNIVIGGETYYGVGEFGSIGGIEDVGDANPAAVEMTLQGIPGTMFSAVMQSNIRGATVTVHKVLMTELGTVLAAEAILVGQVVEYGWQFDETGTFNLQVADEFSLYERPLEKYYTDNSWQKDHDGDRFWRYVAQLASKELHWGAEQDGSKFQ
jgi:hypothetical protein